jgi:ABC-type uncharacterized transport system ATPase subunit
LTELLRLRGISKRYGPVVACDAVDLTVREGEVHGLLGENGAGKSTLMNVLLGLTRRDGGTIVHRGQTVEIGGPRDAAALGFGMVHQQLSLVEPLTVWENVILGDRGRVDRAKACAGVEAVAARYGLPVDPLARVDRLSAGERQRVEIVKCLRRDPSVLVLDEPTSLLTEAESAELFAVLRRVVRAGHRAVILISHRLAEITAATDRVTVLRRGQVVHTGQTARTTPPELARWMVGREVALTAEAAALGMLVAPAQAAATTTTAPVLRVRDLRVLVGGAPRLDGLSLEVAPGEILGLYGVEGNGQDVFGDVLAGLVTPDGGTVEVGGQPVDLTRPGALHRAGVGVVPEDRRTALVLDLTVAENLAMKAPMGAFLNRRRMRSAAERLVDEYGIAVPSLDAPVRTLSGGNQQRLVLARELSASPRVLVAAQPTQGLDVGAIGDVHRRFQRVADQGVGVLLISTQLEEVVALASRVAVISSGRIAGVLPAGEATGERLGLLVGGA